MFPTVNKLPLQRHAEVLNQVNIVQHQQVEPIENVISQTSNMNRLKFVKRSKHGLAHFDLLRFRFFIIESVYEPVSGVQSSFHLMAIYYNVKG